LEILNKTKNKDIRLINKNLSSILNNENHKIYEIKTYQSQSQSQNLKNKYISNKACRNSIHKTSSKNMILFGKKEKEIERINSKKFIMKMKSISNSEFKVNRLIDLKNKGLNDSSQNYIMENNSQRLKDNLNNEASITAINNTNNNNTNTNTNNNSINITNNSNNLSNKNVINSINNYIFKTKKSSIIKNEENDFNENYQDIILNKSNKALVLIIKIYIIIILLLMAFIVIFCGFKIRLTLNFKSLLNYYFIDFYSITNRYMILTYYFNILRTLIIFPEDDRKKKFEKIIKNISSLYDEENKNFINILSNRIKNYKETKKLIEILQTKNNSTEIFKNTICLNAYLCEEYLNSDYNIFDSGVDFTYKTCINQISNIYLDYIKLNNRTNIIEIKKKLISLPNSQFENIGMAINNVFTYVQNKIYEKFKIDQLNFQNKFNTNMTLFNIISVGFSFLTFLFVNIIIFFSISNFSKPIKNSTYRINCSFYYIKKYSLTNRKD